jgi:type IV pilus assembly protein PilW
MKTPAQMRGLTLIELMVAIAIGLFIVLAVVNVMVTQEGIRRGATSGSDATANSAIGMLLLERSLKNSGYGMSVGVSSGLTDTCGPQGVSVENSTRSSQTFSFAPFQFAPVTINPTGIPGGDANTHVIRITYSGSQTFGAPAINSKAVAPLVRVGNRAGLNAGDLVVLGQAGVGCGFRQITALPNNMRCSTGANSAESDVVRFSTGSYLSDYNNCASKTAAFNRTADLPFAGFTASTTSAVNMRIFSVGDVSQFRSTIYAIRGGELTMCDFMTSACEDASKTGDATVWMPVVADVVSMRAQYGIDTDANGSVDNWTDDLPTAIATINNTVAVRVAIVTRARTYNKDEVTAAAPTWTVGSFDISHLDSWKHYKYTVNETTVPLKNVIWNN